jgi:hypothetical protein
VATRQAAARFTLARAALVAGLATVAAQSGEHLIARLRLGRSSARGTASVRGTWLVVLACGVTLSVGSAASAAVGDTEARRVLQRQASAIKAQFAMVQPCVTARSEPCLRSATYRLYAVVLVAKGNVVALRARHLSPRVRSGVEGYLRALDHETWASYTLYQAAVSRDVSRLNHALTNMRLAFAVAGQAMARINP